MKSIRHTLTVRLLVGSCVLLAAVDLAVGLKIRSSLGGEFDAGLESKARTIASLVEQKGDRIEFDFVSDYMPEFGERDDDDRDEGEAAAEYFQLFDASGSVLARSPSLDGRDLVPVAAAGDPLEFRDTTLPDGRRGRLVRIAFIPYVDLHDEDVDAAANVARARAHPIGVVLVTAAGRGELDGLVRALFVYMAVLSLLFVGAVAAVIRYAVRSGLAPLSEISGQVEAIDGLGVGRPIGLSRPVQELESLVETFNRMLERIEAAWQRERRFSSDVAHELRTPLAELRSLAEVGARWPREETAVRGFFEDVTVVSSRMEKLTQALMLIARSENHQLAVDWRDVAVGGLVDECWRSIAGTAARRRVTIDNRVAPALRLRSDPTLLSTIVANVLDNAAAYAEPGSAVECSAARSGDGFRLTFANRAPALEPADVNAMFDRFWRKDPSRSDGNHTGLGLSVVRALCDALGYRVDVRLAPDGVLSLDISSP